MPIAIAGILAVLGSIIAGIWGGIKAISSTLINLGLAFLDFMKKSVFIGFMYNFYKTPQAFNQI